jgi:phosphoglycolate phosphatase
MLRLITFDLDGTLADTAGEIAEAVHLTFDDFALARRSDDEIIGLIGRGTRELLLKLMARVLIAQPALADRLEFDTVMARFDQRYAETAGRRARPYPGCQAMLERLRQHGIGLACVTNKEQRHAERVLQALGLAGYFTLLVGGDTLPVKKPDAGVLAHVLRVYRVAPHEAAHVGDSFIDVQTARNAGVQAWAVPYGYNGGVPVADARPDRLFDDLAALTEHVLAGDAETAPAEAA